MQKINSAHLNLTCLLLLLLAACSPQAAAPQLASSSAAATETFSPTEPPLPTEAPDPMLEGSQNIPEGTGTIKSIGDDWIFNSPLEAEVGKNVPVQFLEHTYEDGTTEAWIALVEHPEWPLFIQNEETNQWETALEYVEVKRPLVDEQGSPLPLTCEFSDDLEEARMYPQNILPVYNLECFFLANEESFREGDTVYQPIAIPMEGNLENPWYTNVSIPYPDWLGVNLAFYNNRIYNPTDLRGSATNEEIHASVDGGDVFWVQVEYDYENLDEAIAAAESTNCTAESVHFCGNEYAALILNGMKIWKDSVRSVFTSLADGNYVKAMGEPLELWKPYVLGAGK